MEKSKLFKKFLAITLAGATLFQSGFMCFETHARNNEKDKSLTVYRTSTGVLGTLTGAGIIAVACLGAKARRQAKRIEEMQSKTRNLDRQLLSNEAKRVQILSSYDNLQKNYDKQHARLVEMERREEEQYKKMHDASCQAERAYNAGMQALKQFETE